MPADAAPVPPLTDAPEGSRDLATPVYGPWRFLWFAPNAGNWVTYQMEHRAAEALARAGHEVVMIQCDGVLSAYCQVMVPMGLTPSSTSRERLAACRECRFAAGLARNRGTYQTLQLSHYLTDGDIAEAEQVLAGVTRLSWENVEASGIPVGRYAAYTTLLHHKTPDVTSSEDAWAEYRADLRGALLTAAAIPRILAQTMPTHAVVLNALYPANRVFAELALMSGVPLANLSGGPSVARRYATLAVYDGVKASQTQTDSRSFRQALDVPLSTLEVDHVEHHLEMLMSAADPWVYSAAASRRSARQVRETLGARPESSIVTIIVSSPDETRASLMVGAEFLRDPAAGYSDVPEFVRTCIELARGLPELDFVFRLHPRLAPNKRERLVSPDLERIDALLAELPVNALVNYPADEISLYDLVLTSDAAVNQSSSAGLEFLSFGLPVVQYDPVRLGAYPVEFGEQAERGDVDGLRDALLRALAAPWDLGRCIRAYRWYAGLQIRSVVPLKPLRAVQRDAVSTPDQVVALRPHPIGRYLPRRLKERIAIILQRRRRAGELGGDALDEGAVQALLAAFDSVHGEGDVWEPAMNLPAGTSEAEESASVRGAVDRLLTRMNVADKAGMGKLRAAGLT